MIEIIKSIKSQIKSRPNVGIILGSGLSQLCTQLENKIVIKYTDIPSFMNTTVDGHKGEFIIGNLSGSNQTLMFANGRFHYYEGIDYEKTHIIIDIFHKIGCKYIITTNSSGCLQPSWSPGDLMIINSHIDATFRTTPSTPVKLYGDDYYNPKLIDIALEVMDKLNIKPRLGTYGWTLGPTYETPAEVKMLKELGVSAVGMSTVPEIERTYDLKLKLLSLACLTNYAVGISSTPLTHDEVVTKANESSLIFSKLIIDILKKIELL